jgi:hypothetical protein
VVAESAYADRQAWADEYVRSANSDAGAVAAFGPRDGRSPDEWTLRGSGPSIEGVQRVQRDAEFTE